MDLLRFDPETTHVREYVEDGTERIAVCALGADFLSPIEDCDGQQYLSLSHLTGVSTVAIEIGGEEVRVADVKLLDTIADPGPPGFAAGIGELGQDGYGSASERLEYVRVGGVEYGANPVAGEDEPETQRLALTVAPNPTPGPLAIAFDLASPSAVTAEVFDALGRRVWRTRAPLGTGRQRLDVEAATWAPGLYVVRVATGDGVATARVIRR